MSKYSLTVITGHCTSSGWAIEGYDSIDNIYTISYKEELMYSNRYAVGRNQACGNDSPTHHEASIKRAFSFIHLKQISKRDCSREFYLFPLTKIVFQGSFSKEYSICKQRRAINFHLIYICLYMLS